MHVRIVLFFCLLVSMHWSAAEEPSTGPVIEGYGPTYPLQKGDIPLPDGLEYKVLFDIAGYAGEPDSLNQQLNTVARFLNMHVRNGVSPDQLNVAVVLHGEALKSALRQESYLERYRVENPNLELLDQLDKAGVRFFACGQSLGFRNIDREELLQPVAVGLSAMTLSLTFIADGYTRLP